MPNQKTSSIPAVIDALLALLTAAPELEGFAVCDGYPVNQPNDLVVIGGTTQTTASGSQEHRTLGRSGSIKRENYSVEVAFSCFRGGTAAAQKIVRDRVFAAVGGLENAIAADPTLGGLVRIASVVTLSLSQSDPETAAQGRLAEVEVQVQIENDLRL